MDLKTLLTKLYNNTLKDHEYKKLIEELIKMFIKVSNSFKTPLLEKIAKLRCWQKKDVYEDVVKDFIVILLKNRKRFEKMLKASEQELRAYIKRSIGNYLVDMSRKKLHYYLIESGLFKENQEEAPNRPIDTLGKHKEEDSLNNKVEEEILHKIEVNCVRDIFFEVINEEEIKYFCYRLDSKRYKCLWGNKSRDAMYQDVKRKSNSTYSKFLKAIKENDISEDAVREFIRIYMSKICEDLRLKICKEVNKEDEYTEGNT